MQAVVFSLSLSLSLSSVLSYFLETFYGILLIVVSTPLLIFLNEDFIIMFEAFGSCKTKLCFGTKVLYPYMVYNYAGIKLCNKLVRMKYPRNIQRIKRKLLIYKLEYHYFVPNISQMCHVLQSRKNIIS